METNKIIGKKIKALREMKNISMEEISGRSGLSISEIQRIEGNEDFPSVAPLIKIARVLGVRLGTFLDDQQELGPVVCRHSEHENGSGIGFTNNGKANQKNMSYFSLAHNKSGRHLEPFLIDITPTPQGENFIPSTHEGEEFIFVMNGCIEIDYGKTKYLLEAGDSIYYDSIIPHHVHAAGNAAAQILGIIYTPF